MAKLFDRENNLLSTMELPIGKKLVFIDNVVEFYFIKEV